MKNFLNKTKDQGFVILFAVVLSSIMLAVAIGMANIAYKQTVFTTSAKDTNAAFFAADTGSECALYYDLQGTQSFFGVVNPFGSGSTVTTSCAGTIIDLYQGSSTGPWTFHLVGLGADGQACATVTVTKTTSPESTEIVSKGYSTGGDTADCSSSDVRRVERQIEINY